MRTQTSVGMVEIVRLLLFVTLFSLHLVVSGCGYRPRGSFNPLTEYGIQNIYIPASINRTIEPGMEYIFGSQLAETFSRARGLKIVNNAAAADATLQSTVQILHTTPTSTIVGTEETILLGTLPKDAQLATSLNTEMVVNFQLVAANQKVIWNSTIQRSRAYPASARLDFLRSSNPLTNDSLIREAAYALSTDIASQARDQLMEAF